MYYGFDIGGSKIALGVFNQERRLQWEKRVATPKSSYEDFLQAVEALVREADERFDQQGSVGIGIPGMPETEDGTLYAANVPAASGKPLRADLSARLDRDVRLDNDANCFALSEAWDDEFTQYPLVMGLILGTGVGGGIIINGQLYTGCNGIAGEIGHMVIRKDGEPCNCGRRGCLEAYCSAASLVRFAERALEDGRKSVLAVHKGQLNAKQICDAVDAGDALAQELFDEYCGNLANGLASFVNLFQPESIVLGGGLAGYGEKLLEPLRMLTFPQTFRGEDRNTEIVCASLGNDAGLVGAAMLVE